MPGLLRGVARTAVIAGTATAVSNRVSRRQAGRWAEQERAQADEQQQNTQHGQPASAPRAGAPAESDVDARIARLRALGELRDRGVLSDAEFDAEKSRLLAS